MTDHAKNLRLIAVVRNLPACADAADHLDTLTRDLAEARTESAAYRAERDKMRRWAEAAAADENANAADLRAIRDALTADAPTDVPTILGGPPLTLAERVAWVVRQWAEADADSRRLAACEAAGRL